MPNTMLMLQRAAAAFALATALSTAPTSAAPDPWFPVSVELSLTQLLSKFAFTAGNVSGRQYAHERGGITLDTQMLMASASKFPAASAIAGAVNEGHLTFDTRANQVFDWWTTHASDRRSRVTLRQLLSFTSGFYWEDPSGFVPCMEGNGSITVHPEDCAKQVYELAPFEFEPGTTFAYNSFHLQVAGAMAAKAAGLTVVELLDKYLIKKLGMKGTGWLVGQNPMLAASMHTTPGDYDRFLHAYLSNELLPTNVTDQMELDYLSPPFATQVANSSTDEVFYFGHYSLCNWYECMNTNSTGNASWTKECMNKRVHQDLGLFGYYPIIDRKNQVYMQVAQQYIEALNSSADGVGDAVQLRLEVTPAVYRALGVPPPPPSSTEDTARARATRPPVHMGAVPVASSSFWARLQDMLP